VPAELAEALEPFAEVRPVVWTPYRGPQLSSSASVDLWASPEESAGSGGSVLSGAQTVGMSPSTISEPSGNKLSRDEIEVLRSGQLGGWRWLKLLLFLLAAAVGFAIGALTIANSIPHD
jgi:hypothetical protein